MFIIWNFRRHINPDILPNEVPIVPDSVHYRNFGETACMIKGI